MAGTIGRVSALDDIYRLIATHFDLHQAWPSELRLDPPRLHALAREVNAEDFQRICLHVRLRARQTPGASAGGRSVVQLTDAESASPQAKDRARLWLDVREARPRTISFEGAFFPRPETWGLRGDPHLWDALRRRFASKVIPPDDQETAAVLHYAIGELAGCDLRTADEHVAVPAFSIGSGMSDGYVDRDFWLRTAIPLLVQRAADLRDKPYAL